MRLLEIRWKVILYTNKCVWIDGFAVLQRGVFALWHINNEYNVPSSMRYIYYNMVH